MGRRDGNISSGSCCICISCSVIVAEVEDTLKRRGYDNHITYALLYLFPSLTIHSLGLEGLTLTLYSEQMKKRKRKEKGG